MATHQHTKGEAVAAAAITATGTVVLVAVAVQDDALQVLVEQDGTRSALPARPVGAGLDLDADAAQALSASLSGQAAHLEQLGAFGPYDRGRGDRVVMIAYLALVGPQVAPSAATHWAPLERVLSGPTAIEPAHQEVTAAAVERVRDMMERTTAAIALCAPVFTVAELHRVYETVWEQTMNAANFRRKVISAPGFLEPTGERTTGIGRPAELYRRGSATRLHPGIPREK